MGGDVILYLHPGPEWLHIGKREWTPSCCKISVSLLSVMAKEKGMQIRIAMMMEFISWIIDFFT